MLNIPEDFLHKLLESNWEWIVKKTIFNVQDILDRTPDFFEEYTDHGVKHINNVIGNAEKLVPENILRELKAEDVGILLCSIIIHDLGMFIEKSQFSNFIKKENRIEGISVQMSKLNLWNEFCHLAKRFSEKKWNDLVGSSYEKVPKLEDYVNWTQRDCLIIGDFLRCYHHRIAFEVALYGFMGREILPEDIPENKRKMIGLIAYSHCIAVRDDEIEKYCKGEWGRIDYICDCPIYYLIVLLRLADCLDTGVERAPKAFSDIHIFLSETSRKEWILNQNFCSNDIGWRQARETHSLDIPVNPKSTTEFVNAEKRLANIQKEFDTSVAILDEKYHGTFLLTVSRITSSIFERERRDNYAKRFFLNDTRLSVSSKILPLLVGPLYSYDPAYGVRELIQNAVDACKEVRDPGYIGKINVNIDTSKKIFLIEDNGIGMDENVISNYYLKAGASYRNSESWRKDFIDDFGKSTLDRIGQFGIGALATFLIGDKVTVTTRRRGYTFGCEFVYTIDAGESLDVLCKDDIQEGTCIKIEMSENVCKYFSNEYKQKKWSRWYRYEKPEIEIILNGNKIINEDILPLKFKNEDGWYRYDSKLYKDFIWSYDSRYSGHSFGRELICNGVFVEVMDSPYLDDKPCWSYSHWSFIRNWGFDMFLPLISLKDYEGRVKMDLSRRKVESLQLERGFIEEIYKYLLAEILTDEQFNAKITVWESVHGYIPLAYSNKGYTVLARSFILHTGSPIWCLVTEKNRPIDIEIPLGYMHVFFDRGIDSIHYGVGEKFNGKTFLNRDLLIFDKRIMKCCGGMIYRNDSIRHRNSERVSSKNKKLENIYCCNMDEVRIDKGVLNQMVNYLDKDNAMFLEYIPTPIREEENNLMIKILQKYIPADRNGGWIPYEMEERKKIYPEAFKELEGYMIHKTIKSLNL